MSIYIGSYDLLFKPSAIIKEAAQITLFVPLAFVAGSLHFQPAAQSQKRHCSPHHPARRRWMTQPSRAAVPSAAPVSHHHRAMDTQERCKFPSTHVDLHILMLHCNGFKCTIML